MLVLEIWKKPWIKSRNWTRNFQGCVAFFGSFFNFLVPENVIEEMENSSLSLHVLQENENVELISPFLKQKSLTEVFVLCHPELL